MDDTSVQKPEAHVLKSRKRLSRVARFVAAAGFAAGGLVSGPLSHHALADVTYCRHCQSGHSPGNADGGRQADSWSSPQNNSN